MIKEEMKTRRDIYEYDALSWVLYQRKEYAEARKASDKALELNTPEPLFHFHAAMIAIALDDRAAARRHLEQAQVLPEARAALKENR